MAKLVKEWGDGGNLTVTYDGDGDGEAIFSSDEFEGIDRSISVTFRTGNITIDKSVMQEGLRQQVVLADGRVLCVKDGGRFGVLKK